MTRRLLAVLAIGALSLVPARAQAQFSPSFSIAGGAAIPTGTLGNDASTGYNVAGALNFGAPLLPVGMRLEAGYNSFNAKNLPAGVSSSQSIISGTVNGTFGLGLPYLIGGLGYYSTKATASSGSTTVTSDRVNAVGINGGVGLRFPLGVISTFAEVRYHKMMGDANTGGDASYVPITFGINF